MIIVGVTGKIASGKSSVCKYLKTLDGIIHLDLDKAVWEILDYPEIRDLLDMRYPMCVEGLSWHDYSNEVLRKELSKKAFSDFEVLDFLEDITIGSLYPLFRQKVSRYSNCHVKILLVESAILSKTGPIQYWCGHTIEVVTDEEDRRDNFKRRAMKGSVESNELLDAKFDAISKRQSGDEKNNLITLHNKGGCFNYTKKMAEEIINNILNPSEQNIGKS